MSKHLISATLTAEAFELYSHWVKERQGSKMISRAIIEQFQDISYSEQIVEWRKNQLVYLVNRILRYIPKEDWFKISEDDRYAIWHLAHPNRSYDLPEMSWDYVLPSEPHPTIEQWRGES